MRQGARNVLIDLSGVHYIDSTRLGELIAAHVTVSRQGGRLKLVRTPQRVVELLLIAGLGDVFERFESVDDAKKSLELARSGHSVASRRLRLAAAKLAIEIQDRRRIVLHHLELRDDLAHRLFFLDLLGDEPLELGHRGERLLA